MGGFAKTVIILTIFFTFVFLGWAVYWQHGGFERVYVFVPSAAFMVVGFIYLVAGVKVSPGARIFWGMLFMPRLLPRRLEGTGPNTVISYFTDIFPPPH